MPSRSYLPGGLVRDPVHYGSRQYRVAEDFLPTVKAQVGDDGCLAPGSEREVVEQQFGSFFITELVADGLQPTKKMVWGGKVRKTSHALCIHDIRIIPASRLEKQQMARGYVGDRRRNALHQVC